MVRSFEIWINNNMQNLLQNMASGHQSQGNEQGKVHKHAEG